MTLWWILFLGNFLTALGFGCVSAVKMRNSNFGRMSINHRCVLILCAFIGFTQSQILLTREVKAIVFALLFLFWLREGTRQVWCIFSSSNRTKRGLTELRQKKKKKKNGWQSIKPWFRNTPPPHTHTENDPSRHHCCLVNLVFVRASHFFLCCSRRIKNMQMETDTRKKKCWHLSSSLPPKHTHTPCAHYSLSSLLAQFWWVCLFWLSLKRNLTIADILPAPHPFIPSILGPLSQTGQVLGQNAGCHCAKQYWVI